MSGIHYIDKNRIIILLHPCFWHILYIYIHDVLVIENFILWVNAEYMSYTTGIMLLDFNSNRWCNMIVI